MDSPITLPTETAAQSIAPTPATEVPTPVIKDETPLASLSPAAPSFTSPAVAVDKDDTCDTVDAPVGPPASLATQEVPVKTEEPQAAPEKEPEKEEQKSEEVKQLEEEEQVACPEEEPAIEMTSTVAPVDVVKEDITSKAATEVSQPPPSTPEPAAPLTQDAAPEPEPTPAEPAEPLLSNGLPQDIEELSEEMAFEDTTPCDKTETSQSQELAPVAKTAAPVKEKEVDEEEKKETEGKLKTEDAPPASVSNPTEESSMQGTAVF